MRPIRRRDDGGRRRIAVAGAPAGFALLLALSIAGAGTAPAAAQPSVALVAVDADPAGNTPRAPGSAEECVSAEVGQEVVVDIVVPGGGVPGDRGMAAYQFSLLYNHEVVWVTGDDGMMLLDQAAGSNVVPITDPRPDRNGVYVSWAVDFGPSGVEPAGSSEAGPGVLARLTLLPQRAGSSPLTLSGPLIIGDDLRRIPIEAVGSASLRVGQPCPGGDEHASATEPTPLAPPAGPSQSSNSPAGGSGSASADRVAQPRSRAALAGEVPAAGGAPAGATGASPLQVAAGAGMSLAGAAMIAGAVKRRTRHRAAASLRAERQ